MTNVVAFDSKEFNIPGKVRDFFSSIGIGLKIRDRTGFQKAYRSLMIAEATKRNFNLKRSVFDSYTLTRLLGGQDSYHKFYSNIISELREYFEQMYVFYSIIPPSKIPRLFIYSEQTEVRNPVDFLKEHKAGFVVLCGWKYSEIIPVEERASTVYLDYFEAKHTKAWDALIPLHPKLFIRGDTCNPCIAAADGILAVLDKQLKRNFYIDSERLSDKSINHALKDLSLKGQPIFIGQPDLHKIVPDSRDQIITKGVLAHPIHFLCPEAKPDGMTNQEYREMIAYTPVMDQLVERAADSGGSIKFYDATTDYLIASDQDYFAYFGDRGKGMCKALTYHVQVKPLELSSDE